MEPASLPAIDGVSWRMFRDGDFVDMTRLLNEDLDVGGHSTFLTVEEVTNGFRGIDGFDPHTDILVAEADGVPIGYVAAATWKELDGTQILFHAGRVTQPWKRHGIGTAMLGWAHGRLDELKDDGATLIRTTGVSPSTTEFMTKHGYEVTQHEAILVRPNLDDIPDIPLPAGLEVRPVDEGDLRAVYEAEVEHFKDHWGASEESSTWWESFQDDPHRDMSMWQIAFDGDRIVGIVRPYVSEAENEHMGRKRGYTEDISTSRDWRGNGVARALIARALVVQRDRGLEESALSVHVENPHGAYRLYESMGFLPHSRTDTLELVER
jgi:mycothiol synthase